MKKRLLLLFILLSTIFIPDNISASISAEPVLLPADSLSIDEVVVTGSRPSVSIGNLPMSVSVVSELQIERRMEQSILPLLTEQVPGLFVTSRGVLGYGVSGGAAGGISIRGVGASSAAQILVLIDGEPQYMGIMGHAIADAYQSLLAERIEIVRGPASVLYGSNAMGGVVNIITRQAREEGVRTELKAQYGSYNTLNAQAANSVRKGKFNSYLSLGYDRTDGHRENMEFEQYTGFTRIGYDINTNWKSYADLNLTYFESENPGAVDDPMLESKMDIFRGMASFALSNSYERTSGAFKFYYNFGYHRINDGYRPANNPRDYRYRSRDKLLGVSVYQNYSLFKGNQTTLGADYQHFGGHAWNTYLNGNPDADIARESVNGIAGYFNFQQMLLRMLTLNAGVRIDHHSVTGSEWIPQLGLSWFAGENTVLKGIVSKGFRNPTIREMFMFGNSNPELRPEKLMNYEISLSQSLLQKTVEVGFNLFYIKGDNAIVPDGSQLMNTGEIENYGIEVSARYHITPHMSVNSNYSYLHMEEKIEASPEHKLYAGADYYWRRWSFAVGMLFVRNLYTGERMETFTLLNARVSCRVTDFMDIQLRGENLLAQRYEVNDGFPMPRATVFAGLSLRF